MISLTRTERDIRRVLVNQARGGVAAPESRCLTYEELGKAFDPRGEYLHSYPMSVPPFRGLGEALGHISMYEADHGRPLLSSLVVRKAERTPGPGFGDLARHIGFEVSDDDEFWKSEVRETVEFWSDDDPTRFEDARHERVMRELVTIKRLLRAMGSA